MTYIKYDARDFKKFASMAKATAPKLERKLKSSISKVGRLSATEMRNKVPHQGSTGNWGSNKGVHFSSAVSAKGGAIVIDHLAETFGVGNRGVGKFKHKVFGVWSDSSKTIEDTSDFIFRTWEEVGPKLDIAAEAALEELIQAMAFGALE